MFEASQVEQMRQALEREKIAPYGERDFSARHWGGGLYLVEVDGERVKTIREARSALRRVAQRLVAKESERKKTRRPIATLRK